MDKTKICCKEGVVRATLPKELDHHTAESARKAIDEAVSQSNAGKLILDFSCVDFADSSAVGLLLGRYKLMQRTGGELCAVNMRGQCKRLLELSGIQELIPIKENEK